MKKLFVLGALIMSFQFAVAQYRYKCFDKYIELTQDENSDYTFIQFRKSVVSDVFQKLVHSIPQNSARMIRENQFYVDKRHLDAFREHCFISEMCKTPQGYHATILPRIMLKLRNGQDIDAILKLVSKFDVTIADVENNRYVLDCDVPYSKDVMEIVSMISGVEGVVYCEPDMYCSCGKDDTYYSEQYYLKNNESGSQLFPVDINVEPVWNITIGSPDITVAVIDDGIDIQHEDFGGRVLPGFTPGFPLEHGEPHSANSDDANAHGTACAGIIAASHNDIGIRGVAGGVKLLPVNIKPFTLDADNGGFVSNCDKAKAISWAAARADVLSLSVHFGVECSCVIDAINDARTNGRNGKGCIIVAAAGNEGNNYDVNFPANMSGVIAVGAILKSGQIWADSQTGPSLDLVALGGGSDIVTTDRRAPDGYDSTSDYMFHFGGTSAACPQVSGTAALLLSVNPDLTESEVRSILTGTARKLSGMGGANRTDTYGYGLVNAYAAVSRVLTQNLSIVGDPYPCGLTSYHVDNLPSGFSVNWTFQDSPLLLNRLHHNIPQQNYCSIENYDHAVINATLVAKIYGADGAYVTSLTKDLNTAYGFSAGLSATYVGLLQVGQQPPGPVSASAIADGETFLIAGGYEITLTSADFATHTVTYTGSGVRKWTNYGNGTIVLQLDNLSHTSTIAISGINGCHRFEFKLKALPNMLSLDTSSLGVSQDGSLFTVSLHPDNGDNVSYEANPLLAEKIRNLTWNLSIVNVLTGEVVYKGIVKGNTQTLDTSSWRSGAYAVRAELDEQTVTKKISVRLK